ncbi:MAG TPA: Trp biosynthesis-associated membrane protein [Actinoplanes sp.]|nr:Trp biosynthesis-associated membrane protein [Actinoplanes sp.]
MKLAHATVACLAGAGLALFGATRVWSVQVTPRPGLSDLRTSATGADAQPWLVALALIALAGAGALLATRGPVRRGLGLLIMVIGAGLAVVAVVGRTGIDPGEAGAGATVWPVACVLGAALVALAGLGAARHGHRWPVMGARYERRPVPWPADRPADHSEPSPAAGRDAETGNAGGGGPHAADRDTGGGGAAGDDGGGAGLRAAGAAPVDNRALWDALDRGDDPTAR